MRIWRATRIVIGTVRRTIYGGLCWPGTAQCGVPRLHYHHHPIISHLARALGFPLLPLLPIQSILLPGLQQFLKNPHPQGGVVVDQLQLYSSRHPGDPVWAATASLCPPPTLFLSPAPIVFHCSFLFQEYSAEISLGLAHFTCVLIPTSLPDSFLPTSRWHTKST